MARRVNWWLAAGLAGCLAVAVGYVPPRGASRRGRGYGFASQPRATRAQQQASALAAEWRGADNDLQMAQRRRTLAAALDQLRNTDRPTLVVAFEGTVDSATRDRVRRLADSTWQGLGLGTTKIGVGVIVAAGPDPAERDHPRRIRPLSPAFSFPDSLDRHTCLGYVTLSRTAQLNQYVLRDLDGIVRRTMGPCAFYAAFGRPSPVIERWLAARAFDLTLDAAWDRGADFARSGASWFARNWMPTRANPWMWAWLYQSPPATVGCIGGRSGACRDYVLAGSTSTRPLRGTVTTDFERRGPTLPGATLLLSDALREFGPARFARFWTTPLAVDSAFHVAMDTTLADWVTGRQVTLTPRLPVGPSAPFTSSLLGLLAAALAVAVALITGHRRQVA